MILFGVDSMFHIEKSGNFRVRELSFSCKNRKKVIGSNRFMIITLRLTIGMSEYVFKDAVG